MHIQKSSRWRTGLVSACIVLAAIALATLSRAMMDRPTHPDRERFRAWLEKSESQQNGTDGLYPYYRSEERGFESSADDYLSPVVSAKCILFWLEEHEIERAVRTADRLLYWQEIAGKDAHPRVTGALPSRIHRDGSRYVAGDRYYSGDNLLVLEALLAVYERTGNEDLLEGAGRIAKWLSEVMCRGERFGVWREDHGAPMHFVTVRGDFDNRIFTNLELLWIGALRRFGMISGDMDYIERYEKARGFLLRGQSEYGVWFDRYDPGYPPKPYDVSRWQWYGEGGVVVADNALRAALGALRVGARDQAERFADWLHTDRGAVFAYLDASTGRGRFDHATRPYYDVVVSGLWRVLARELGRENDVKQAERFLMRTQNKGGGWYWGRQKSGLRPVQRSEAVLTGFWAVTNLDYR